MKKALLLVGALSPVLLSGCGGGNYTIMGRDEGTGQVTYRVQVKTETTESEAEEIAKELQDGSKNTMVNFYDGPRSVENMIYSCYDGDCYDSQPGR